MSTVLRMRVTTLLLLHHNSKNTGAIRSNFLWTLSGLMVSMSLHLGPVALPEVLRRRETTEHIVMLSSPHDSPFILVLCISRSSRNSDGVTPCGAAAGYKNVAIFDNNLLYLRNGWRKMGICSEAFYKHWILFPTMWHLPRFSQRRTQGRPKCAKNVLKWRTFELTGLITGKRLKTDG